MSESRLHRVVGAATSYRQPQPTSLIFEAWAQMFGASRHNVNGGAHRSSRRRYLSDLRGDSSAFQKMLENTGTLCYRDQWNWRDPRYRQVSGADIHWFWIINIEAYRRSLFYLTSLVDHTGEAIAKMEILEAGNGLKITSHLVHK